MKALDVTIVGEIYLDHVFSGFARWPRPGEEVLTDTYTKELGGGAATTACGLAKIGRSVSLMGLIGASDAQWIYSRLDTFGVHYDSLLAMEGATGVTVSVSTLQDRSFFTHTGLNRDLGAHLMSDQAVAHMTRARHVHFSMPLSREVAEHVLPRLRTAHCTTSLDVGYQPDWLGDSVNAATLREIDHFLPNEKEAELLCGQASENGYFSRTKALGLRAATLKLGARGAMTEYAGQRYHAQPPVVKAIDTTGAGDAFNVGFIDGLLDDCTPVVRLQRACISGALSTQSAGALNGLPPLSMYRSFYDQTYERA
jgi:sugar/nucleoside kinase (ribokinase family)